MGHEATILTSRPLPSLFFSALPLSPPPGLAAQQQDDASYRRQISPLPLADLLPPPPTPASNSSSLSPVQLLRISLPLRCPVISARWHVRQAGTTAGEAETNRSVVLNVFSSPAQPCFPPVLVDCQDAGRQHGRTNEQANLRGGGGGGASFLVEFSESAQRRWSSKDGRRGRSDRRGIFRSFSSLLSLSVCLASPPPTCSPYAGRHRHAPAEEAAVKLGQQRATPWRLSS